MEYRKNWQPLSVQLVMGQAWQSTGNSAEGTGRPEDGQARQAGQAKQAGQTMQAGQAGQGQADRAGRPGRAVSTSAVSASSGGSEAPWQNIRIDKYIFIYLFIDLYIYDTVLGQGKNQLERKPAEFPKS